VAEAIVNAVAHRDYTSNASVQVMLFVDRLEVWNPGQLPPPLTIATLRVPHASIPHNPLIADPLFLTRYAEKAGSGILDMIALCQKAGLSSPQFRQEGGQFIQTLWRPEAVATPQVTPQVTSDHKVLSKNALRDIAEMLGMPVTQVTPQVATQVAKVLGSAVDGARSREELQSAVGMADREHFRKTYVEPLVTAGWLERTIPDKPTSSRQKYRLTDKGRAWLTGYYPSGQMK
jgi:predicted HTH transcriptional regulator